MTYNYAKTILGLMTRVKDDKGKVRFRFRFGATTKLRVSIRQRFDYVSKFYHHLILDGDELVCHTYGVQSAALDSRLLLLLYLSAFRSSSLEEELPTSRMLRPLLRASSRRSSSTRKSSGTETSPFGSGERARTTKRYKYAVCTFFCALGRCLFGHTAPLCSAPSIREHVIPVHGEYCVILSGPIPGVEPRTQEIASEVLWLCA